jgi:hypothetical protein
MQYVIYNQETGAAEFYDSIEAAQARQAEFTALYPHFDTDLFAITVWQTNADGTITQYRYHG